MHGATLEDHANPPGDTTGVPRESPASLVKAPVRVALIGCGAMARENLLPVLAGHERVNLVALVDINDRAARELADAYQVPHAFGDLAALDQTLVDAAIVATPPALHAAQTEELARRGLHVFVEKPMAVTTAEARRMVETTDSAGVVLSVGLYRRLLPSTRLLRGLVESGLVGAPLSVDIEEGGEYGWPLATLANLTRSLGAGGGPDRHRLPSARRPAVHPAGICASPLARRQRQRRDRNRRATATVACGGRSRGPVSHGAEPHETNAQQHPRRLRERYLGTAAG